MQLYFPQNPILNKLYQQLSNAYWETRKNRWDSVKGYLDLPMWSWPTDAQQLPQGNLRVTLANDCDRDPFA